MKRTCNKRTSAGRDVERGVTKGALGFTLVELLVVIAIIGLLAGLGLGVSGIASRTMKERRVEGELNQLISYIENYHSKIGAWPPDNPKNPAINPLYYELSGVIYDPQTRVYRTVDGRERINLTTVQQWFGLDGFANMATDRKQLKFTAELNEQQFAEISRSLDVEVMVLPASLKGPGIPNPRPPGDLDVTLNTWRYNSSHPTNNPGRYDLWAEVIIGKKLYLFCNWSKEPIVLD